MRCASSGREMWRPLFMLFYRGFKNTSVDIIEDVKSVSRRSKCRSEASNPQVRCRKTFDAHQVREDFFNTGRAVARVVPQAHEGPELHLEPPPPRVHSSMCIARQRLVEPFPDDKLELFEVIENSVGVQRHQEVD